MKYKFKLSIFLICILSMLILASGTVSAVTDVNITSENNSIENAVNSISNEGTIYLSNGIYNSTTAFGNNANITISNKNITVVGQSKEGTIIDGSGVNWLFYSDSSSKLSLINLTLRNFTTSGNTSDDFGIKNEGDNFKISNVIIKDSHPEKGGSNPVKPKLILNTGNNFLLENSEIYTPGGFPGPSITIYNNGSNFTIDGLYFENPNRYGIDNYGDYLILKNSIFINTIPNATSSMVCCPFQSDAKNILITNSTFLNFPCCPVAFDGSNITVSNSTFLNNTESISSSASNVIIKNSYFEFNREAAITNDGGNNILIENNVFKNCADSVINNAPSAASASPGNNITVKGSVFENNMRAIKNAGDNFTVENSSFINNTGDFGAAIYNKGLNFKINNSIFNNNEADSGGAISQDNGTISINNSKFTGNKGQDGSAILVEGGKIAIDSSKFENNNATNRGTIAILNGSLSIFSSHSFFTANKVTNGRNIYVASGNEATIPTSLKITSLSQSGNNILLKVKLSDVSGDSISSKNISLKIDGKTLSSTTNSNGVTSFKYSPSKTKTVKINLAFNSSSTQFTYLKSATDTSFKFVKYQAKITYSYKDKTQGKYIQRVFKVTNKGNLKGSIQGQLKIPKVVKLIKVSVNKANYKYISKTNSLHLFVNNLNPGAIATITVITQFKR